MNITKQILFLIIVSHFMNMNAQNKIQGKFNSISKTFETGDKTYWIDFFNKGVAKISKNGLIGLMDTSGTILCMPKYDAIYDFSGDVEMVILVL